jgi:molybdate transport system substrate-binding protein
LGTILSLFLSCLMLSGCLEAEPKPVIAAAASLRAVMPELLESFGTEMTVTYGGSGTLKQQVQGGAPVDLVVFAAAHPVDKLIDAGLADAETRQVIGHNTLVLIVPTGSTHEPRFASLSELPSDSRIAIGDPAAVPAGHYAKRALQSLKSWSSLQGQLVFTGDVTAALGYARRGEVAAAIVYETDTRSISDVRITDRATWKEAPTPQLVAAATSPSTSARAFLSFLASPKASEILGRFGFRE